ncbi:MAG: hypothetical protein A2010_17405 [Nitrospirae bacterium GWD2_57_9]|nr:MAG: hypothetical protein A2010_17405 [Nitrospirae bacterium GWD2_57_9]OGW47142.1 MAG: hypothetical protein A2078_12415 [Nitrospirae bacterium GWC2_57_9]
MTAPFEFKQSVILLKSTGKKARTLAELRDLIATISEGSIFHHTYQYFLKGHILEYTNDFSHWAGESIEESVLAERLSNLDPYDYADIAQLRKELLRIIDAFRATFPEPREALPRDEFFFNEAVTLVFPAGIRARNLAEFLMAVKHVDASSLYYHFYDSRIRQGGEKNDFSQWFEQELGKIGLAGKIHSVDPFMHSLEGIRDRIAQAVEEEVTQDMESAGIMP